MADRSELGWSIVSEYEADELADHSDKEKRLEKARRPLSENSVVVARPY